MLKNNEFLPNFELLLNVLPLQLCLDAHVLLINAIS